MGYVDTREGIVLPCNAMALSPQVNDLDFVAAKVDGSGASRKYMKNEIWSLISYCGAPTWFVTFAPADIKHPICLYLADKHEKVFTRTSGPR